MYNKVFISVYQLYYITFYIDKKFMIMILTSIIV